MKNGSVGLPALPFLIYSNDMAQQSSFHFEQRQLCRGERVTEIAAWREWMPVAVDEDTADITWRWIGEKRFTEPFFSDALRSQARDERRQYVCTAEQLGQIVANFKNLAPTAFIFHCSRCGSTLLMQLLSCLPQCIALSEPPALDACLQYAYRHPDRQEQAIALLRQLVAAFGQQRFVNEQHLVIKLDSWHICQLPLLRAAFPNTPFYFLYREAAAVLASHLRQPGPQMVPGMLEYARLGLSPNNAAHGLAWSDLLLTHFFQLAQIHAETHVQQLHLLHYEQLPQLVWQQLLATWQISVSADQLRLMQQRATFHAKNLTQFQGDPQSKHSIAVSTALQQAYLALEQMRAKQ